MRRTAAVLLQLALLCSTAFGAPSPLPDPTPERLPRWRGFNLLERFSKDWFNGPYREEDFRLISSLGFNFVRLPLDYRTWITGGDWEAIDPSAFAGIDQAVQWGIRYGIHVCINMHRAPGYCVNPPAEPRDLFTDPAAQRVCALHWAFVARRYKGTPNRNLSFNLLNEPATADGRAYARVVSLLCSAIRAEDPDRLIIADGLSYGTVPCAELAPLRVAQATRGYQPLSLTHFRADWVSGADSWPLPSWPVLPVSSYLYAPEKKELAVPLVVDGAFKTQTRLRIRVGQVSSLSRLHVLAGSNVILDRRFQPGPGAGEWREARFSEEWKIWQNLYDMDVSAVVPAGTRRLEIGNAEGDWMTVSEIALLPEGSASEIVLRPADAEWGRRQPHVEMDLADASRPFRVRGASGAQGLWDAWVRPFKTLEGRGVGVIVGEFGAYRYTPHPVVLAWMRDCLENWRRAGWGWALWNFRGDFGVLDSNRTDVPYEKWQGHLLDREMLDLLQEH